MIHAFPTRVLRADQIESGHQIVGEAGGLMLVIDVYRALGRTHLDTECVPLDVADDHMFTITAKNVRTVVYDAAVNRQAVGVLWDGGGARAYSAPLATVDTVFDTVVRSGYLDSHVGLRKLVEEYQDAIVAAAHHNFTSTLIRDNQPIRATVASTVRTTVTAAIDAFCEEVVPGLAFETTDDEGLIRVTQTAVPDQYTVEGPRGIATITSSSHNSPAEIRRLALASYHAVFVD